MEMKSKRASKYIYMYGEERRDYETNLIIRQLRGEKAKYGRF